MLTQANVGLLIPTASAGQPPSLREFTDFFRRADDAGLYSLWVIDGVFHENTVFDPMTILACAVTVTNRIRLVLRNPVLAAKAAATLDYLSGGRLILGSPWEVAATSFRAWVSPLRSGWAAFGRALR